ncbi:Predicted OmpA family protein [gamma proteobacterium HdN1]|nr:Predicted OmpA family protein [gamma proteobacterium HdN1]
MNEFESDMEQTGPVWAVFGDLMSGLLGAFVLLLIWVMGIQLELGRTLQTEITKRQAEEQQRVALEEALEIALADPLASGRITLDRGRIGISGSVLFALNSAELQPEGLALLREVSAPLRKYLEQRQELLMVSGFTDDLPIQKGNHSFTDNWALSAERALTVTRALIDNGLPSTLVFAAAFGAEQPIASNSDAEGRAKNRRVEIAPVPKTSAAPSDTTTRALHSAAHDLPSATIEHSDASGAIHD